MPENWNPGEQVQDKVVVPIIKALSLVKSMVNNSHLNTNNGISIFKTGHYFKIIVPASRAKGGDIYLDKDLLAIVEKNNFDKVADKMTTYVEETKIASFVQVLQYNHSCSLTLNSAQFREIEKTNHRYNSRKKITIPPKGYNHPATPNIISLLELEAEALALELELLAA